MAQATGEKCLPIYLSLEFVNDIYCEWAYVIDLDRHEFEVHQGYEAKDNPTSKRFNSIGKMNDMVPGLVKSFRFTELPTKEGFIAACTRS